MQDGGGGVTVLWKYFIKKTYFLNDGFPYIGQVLSCRCNEIHCQVCHNWKQDWLRRKTGKIGSFNIKFAFGKSNSTNKSHHFHFGHFPFLRQISPFPIFLFLTFFFPLLFELCLASSHQFAHVGTTVFYSHSRLPPLCRDLTLVGLILCLSQDEATMKSSCAWNIVSSWSFSQKTSIKQPVIVTAMKWLEFLWQ